MPSRMQWLLRSDYDVEQESGKDKNLSVTPVIKTTERHAAPEAGQQLKLFFSLLDKPSTVMKAML